MREKSMILNLEVINNGTNITKRRILFDLPHITFKDCTVNVRDLFIEWRQDVKQFHGIISSSMVDSCPENNLQQILFFVHKKRSNFTHFTPTHLANYQIQCSNFKSSSFKVSFVCPEEKDAEEKEKKVKIENIERIYLQLQIDGYWVQ